MIKDVEHGRLRDCIKGSWCSTERGLAGAFSAGCQRGANPCIEVGSEESRFDVQSAALGSGSGSGMCDERGGMAHVGEREG